VAPLAGQGILEASIDGQFPCDALAILLPGSDFPTTTTHDWQAIVGGGASNSNPAWVRLHYESQADKISSGLSRSWFSSEPECEGLAGTGKSCDEYPFYASTEGGPGASLEPVPTSDNSGAGSRYGVFVRTCGLSSELHTPFLVVPMAFAGAPPTTHFCA
jgi:hypothetical protein